MYYKAEKNDWWCSHLVIRARTVAKWKDERNWEQNINYNFLLKGVRVFMDPAKPTAEREIEIEIVACNILNNYLKKHTAFIKIINLFPNHFPSILSPTQS